MKSQQELMQAILIKRELRRRKASRSLWTFCRVVDDPDYYHPSKWHLRIYCEVLQALIERRLNKKLFIKLAEQYAPAWFLRCADYHEILSRLDDREVYSWLMINLPPRSGKTRTLTHATQWALGLNKRESIMTATYNDVLAQDFSRSTRDGIQAKRQAAVDIVYNDIFPDSSIKQGNAAASNWTLDGGYHSYTGVGLEGSATGRGATIQIVDDPIKDSKVAYNAAALDAVNLWFTSTFFSRQEANALSIINHTRWAENDLCGYMLSLENGDKWFVLKLPAFFDDVQEYLDPAELGKERLQDIKIVLPLDIYEANYNQRTIDMKGRLYESFATYSELPRKPDGNLAWESIVNYTDTADTGSDDLVSLTAGIYNGYAYLLDVIMTDEPMEVTEIEQADTLTSFGVERAMFEGNNGGSNHARAVGNKQYERTGKRSTSIEYFHQSENKQARILSHSADVVRLVKMPEDWERLFPKYYKAMTSYQRKGKNKHDDAPDATTGLVEHFLNAPTLRIGSA